MIAVNTEQVTKVYKLYNKPLDRLKEFLFHRPLHKDLVALSDVTFSLKKGDTLGVIGDNGAGKSTLLKILTKTLSPTDGRVEVQGLITSLLELGSGFHPEFTGVENVFFYGSLLGIDGNLMKKHMRQIIEFAELGDFINYPIKTYSSGMHVRLAFSVATTVDPDILIIDEALSVGDQYFQKKCLEKMDDFKKREKIIIFCSHDLYQIKTFCSKTMWLDHGRIKMFGDSTQVINAYAGHEQTRAEVYREQLQKTNEGSFLFISDISAHQSAKRELAIEFKVKSSEPFLGHIGWAILKRDMFQVSFMTTHMQEKDPVLLEGTKKISIRVQDLNLVNDNYFVYVGIFDSKAYKPIAVESIDCTLTTDYEILNSLCFFRSTFTVE
ncbi:MAG: ABC transporter ATP-binding protein [Thermodesulfovibrionales bacterium]|nr:ABC transporter ATP-binding protein [Thermodesulfovibrionales bacterium]